VLIDAPMPTDDRGLGPLHQRQRGLRPPQIARHVGSSGAGAYEQERCLAEETLKTFVAYIINSYTKHITAR